MNGDLVRVVEADPEAETVRVPLRGRGAVDLRFRDLRLRFRNAEGMVVEQVCKALDNLLFSPSRSLSPEEQTALYVHFRQRYPALSPRSSEFSLALRDDPYFQALQVKFGYALTCHKAQGGEWEEVFVHFDQHRGHRNADFFRWAYTAITRARSRLTVANAPHFNAVTGVRVADLDLPEEPQPLPLPTTPLEAEAGNASADVDAQMIRFRFPAGREHLRALFRAVYGRALAGSVRVLEVVHGQYHERYRLGVEDQVLQFQIYYDGSNRFTRIVPVGRPAEGEAFERVQGLLSAAMQIANMHGELERGEDDRQSWPSALLDLVRLFEPELERRGISLIRREAMSWRERLWFGRGAESAGFDFLYNSLGQWTNIQPVRRKSAPAALDSELAEVFARLG